MKPKVLIVGTVPYNKKSTSRAFEAYFSNWDHKCLAQFFSNTKKPSKGHCESLFQITDQRLVQARFNKKMNIGRIFHYEELEDEWKDNSLEVKSTLFRQLYRLGDKKTPLIYLLRKWVWSKKYWCTKEFNDWLEEFNPECVFLSFSDDYFIQEIALYAAEKFNIPIVSSIGDDYYFNSRFSISPFYYLYKSSYRKLIRNVFSHGGSAIYISDKIRDKYNDSFGLNGKTVYLSSELERKEFVPVNNQNPVISYFGNIRQGRNESLNEIGYALGKISENYYLDIYSNQTTPNVISVFKNNKNVRFHGSIPYIQVMDKIHESDIVVIVEGFKEEHVNNTRYSLSTKAADSLASGAQILVYGSKECGVIEYMMQTNSAVVCTDSKELVSCIKKLIGDVEFQKQNYENSIRITLQNHNLQKSTDTFLNVVLGAINSYAKEK